MHAAVVVSRNLQAAPERFLRYLGQAGIVILHMVYHLVTAAAANAVVRMVFHQLFPHMAEPAVVVRAVHTRKLKQGVQRLVARLQPVLRYHVEPLYIAARGPAAAQQLIVAAVCQMSAVYIGRKLVFFNIVLDHICVCLKVCLHDVSIRQRLVELSDYLKHVVLRLKVVHAVHEKRVWGYVVLAEYFMVYVKQQLCLVLLFGDVLRVVIPAKHIHCSDAAAVHSLPYKLGGHMPARNLPCLRVRLIQRKAAAADKRVYAESAQYLRKLPDVSELVGRIADVAALSKLLCTRPALKQVANDRLAAGQKEIAL